MLEILTWRPYGNGASQQMRRFFTGGAPELEDNLFVKFPTESEVTSWSFLLNFSDSFSNSLQ